jgi:hypothetical protein
MGSLLRDDLPINHMGAAEQSAASAVHVDQPVGTLFGAIPQASGVADP